MYEEETSGGFVLSGSISYAMKLWKLITPSQAIKLGKVFRSSKKWFYLHFVYVSEKQLDV